MNIIRNELYKGSIGSRGGVGWSPHSILGILVI